MPANSAEGLAAISARVLTLPGLKEIRRSGFVNKLLRRGYGSHWGRFASYDEALNFLPPSRRVSYNAPDVARLNLEAFSRVHLFDWPVLFFLQKALDAGSKHVVDFGGHLGVKYVVYEQKLASTREFRWQVVDVPIICTEGRRRFAGPHVNVTFHEDMAGVRACDVLLCSGSLQYSKLTLSEIIARSPDRPKVIIVNKMGVVEGEGFFTLENFGSGRIPYRVFTRAYVSNALKELGYDRIGEWSIPDRTFSVHAPRGMERVSEIGEAWSISLP